MRKPLIHSETSPTKTTLLHYYRRNINKPRTSVNRDTSQTVEHKMKSKGRNMNNKMLYVDKKIRMQ